MISAVEFEQMMERACLDEEDDDKDDKEAGMDEIEEEFKGDESEIGSV